MADFDPRITPARGDLAAEHLRGKVEAGRFVRGTLCEVIDPVAPLRRLPSHDAPLDTEALKGERAMIYDTNAEGWCWGQLQSDGYVGWLPANALTAPGREPTHKVTALRTLVFPAPDIKQPPVDALPFGACVAIVREQDRFGVTADRRYIPLPHLARFDVIERDFVAVAERFTGAPYLWGGKTSLGIDCSGLVQIALTACGILCPRDSDMQERALGQTIDMSRLLRRGDLIFWKRHVAIVRDADTIIHANAHHMAVAIEPMHQAIMRIRAGDAEITSMKRLTRA
jgi:hypothetical protein